MALYLELGIDLTVYGDSTKKNYRWRETDDTINDIVRSDCDAISSGEAPVSQADGADFTVPMGLVTTGKILYISSDVEVNVTIDGGAQELILKPSGAYRGAICLHGEFTGATVVKRPAAAGTTAEVHYCIVGTKA